ncbi:MAG TPA: hypothetical protein VHL54_02740 [Actinomycetota bacterium]|jgi:hypothetical protein|nr:hypothetical protein [Actinomycetota bacterium]
MVTRSKSAIVLGILVLATVVALPSTSTAQTHPRQIAIQHNLFGARQGAGLNTTIGTETRDDLEDRMSEIYLVSLNEVCYWQWEEVQELLTQALGYVPMAHWSISEPTDRCALGGGDGDDQTETVVPNPDPNNPQYNTIFGNVIIGLAPQGGPWPIGASSMFSHQNDPYPPPDNPPPTQWPEYRGTACLFGLRPPYQPSPNVTACTTHLASAPDSMTKHQLNDLTLGAVSTVQANVPFFVMGDLNLVGMAPGDPTEDNNESQVIRDWWYPLFEEGDRAYGSGSKRSTSDYGAIDYVFRRAPETFSQGPAILDSPSSDHHWFETYVWPAY